MTKEQKRIDSMYERYFRILKTIDQLDTVAKLLTVKPAIYFMDTAQIEYSKYLEYHLDIYYLRFTSILDQAVLLVSEFYDLGTDPKQTNLRTLTGNMHTKDKDATAILKKFDKLIQPIKRVRNLVAHRGGFNDKDVMEIEANLYLISMFGKKHQDNPAFDDMFGRVDELIEKKLAFIKKNNDGVLKFLYALDHTLAKEFLGEV